MTEVRRRTRGDQTKLMDHIDHRVRPKRTTTDLMAHDSLRWCKGTGSYDEEEDDLKFPEARLRENGGHSSTTLLFFVEN